MPTTYRSPRIQSICTGLFCFACVALIQIHQFQEGSWVSTSAGLEIVSLEEDVDQTEVLELHHKIMTDLASWKCVLSDAAGNTTLSGFKDCMEPLVNSVKHSWNTEEKCKLVETILACFSPIWTRCLKDPSVSLFGLILDSDNSKISSAYNSGVQNGTES